MRTLRPLLALLALPPVAASAQEAGVPGQTEIEKNLASNINARKTVD